MKPYNHHFTVWFAKVSAKKKGKGEITVKPFHVYKLKSPWLDEEWYLLTPEADMTRIVVENKHHWHEGWGRILVELRRGNERVDGLLVRHKKLCSNVELNPRREKPRLKIIMNKLDPWEFETRMIRLAFSFIFNI